MVAAVNFMAIYHRNRESTIENWELRIESREPSEWQPGRSCDEQLMNSRHVSIVCQSFPIKSDARVALERGRLKLRGDEEQLLFSVA